jgi:hypothetical protein
MHPQRYAIIADGATLKVTRGTAIRLGVARPLLVTMSASKTYFPGLGARMEILYQ